MERYSSVFSSASRRMASAATRTCRDYSVGNLPDEPTFTGALVARLQDALNGKQTSGIFWSARVLSNHGPGAEEKVYGADFLGVLYMDIPSLSVRKGFLAQAKRQEPGSRLSGQEWSRLIDQCRTMLQFTSESFVFVYSISGVSVVPATTVVSCTDRQLLATN